MVIPSEMLRREVLGQLATLGHQAWATESFDEALALVAAGAIDTLVLHASAFSTNVLAQLRRAMNPRRSIALIASVSVVSAVDAARGRGVAVGREGEPRGPGEDSCWRVATYWLPFSRSFEFVGLHETNLN